jgi:hypothetical protein
MRLAELVAAGAVSMAVIGAAEAVPDLAPHPCTIQELCAPLPIALGDEPGGDGPRGPVGPSGSLSMGSSGPTGPTGPSGPLSPTGPGF